MLKVLTFFLIFTSQSLLAKNSLKIAWLGTTCFIISDGKDAILFDPYISQVTWSDLLFLKPLNSRLSYIDKWLSKLDKEKIRGIFISHGHFDHVLDVNKTQILTNAKVYGDSSVEKYLKNKKSFISMEGSQKVSIGEFVIEVKKSEHAGHLFDHVFWAGSSEKDVITPAPFYAYKSGKSLNYLITHKSRRLFFHPSSQVTKDSLLKKPVDILILGIASRRSDEDLQENLINVLRPTVLIPSHYDLLTKDMEKGPEPFFIMKYDSFKTSSQIRFPEMKIPEFKYGLFKVF